MIIAIKRIWKQVFPIFAGVAVALAIIIPAAFLGALIGFSDSPMGDSTSFISVAIVVTGLIAGVLTAGYITATISETKKIAPVLITGVILILLFLWNSGFEASFFTTFEITVLILILPVTCLGGWWGIRKLK